MPKKLAAASSTNKTAHSDIHEQNEPAANSMNKINFMRRKIIGKVSRNEQMNIQQVF